MQGLKNEAYQGVMEFSDKPMAAMSYAYKMMSEMAVSPVFGPEDRQAVKDGLDLAIGELTFT